jgi:protein tyrosine phosphatase (PTP) superfamily phosphohydrolase (DUF442 family)
MKRRYVVAGLILSVLAAACSDRPTRPIPLPPPLELGDPLPLPEDPRRQFDFWLGEWSVVNKRAHRNGSWTDVGNATARIQSVADGAAVIEQWDGTLDENPLIGFSLRAHDEASDRWAVWLNWTGEGPDGFSEMHGRRNGERMELFPPDDDSRLRYSFAEARTGSCQWEQATSKDGQTWITDWVMHFTRRAEPLALDANNAPIREVPESAAEFPQTRALDFLVGAWEGAAHAVAPDGRREEGAVRARVTPMIRGFALLQFVDTSWGDKNLAALGWDRSAEGWVALHVSNRAGGVRRMYADLEDRSVRFTALRAGLRESWSCPTEDTCSWRRETSDDGGATWVATVEAELSRSKSTAAWIDIRNARAPFADVLTGGQPTADQLAWTARNGYRTIVNLRAPDERGDIPGEAELVQGLGMKYIAIPMGSGDDLNAENASRLAEALKDAGALPAMVHCASGNRVGALFGLKAHLEDGLSAEAALDLARTAGISRMEPVLRQRLGLPSE